ncbi:MAG: Rpn family recombination-promoting nuclease/putative transposase [Holosporaceae bacterium]|jgi:predicted transposase/invertase (TIGR01784 family)|nr:Rpn family recombination-promoting nuclease/putative transposase [Holosporaceae bacterium]
MRSFLDPKNDFAFKRLFGVEKHKNILIQFLNDIFEGVHPRIEDVEFLKTAQDPEIAVSRQSIVDVLCKDVSGRQFIIEMQCASDSHFLSRAKAYACRVYLNQRVKKNKDGDNDYRDMKPVIFLAIVNYILFPNKKKYLSHHKHLDIETFECDIEGLSFSFLELKKLDKELHELDSNIEKWMYFFKNAPCTEPSELEEISKNSPIIREAYGALAKYAFTPEELLEYERYDMQKDAENTRLKDAKAEGKAEGLAEGETRKAKETAINLLSMGLSIQQIAKATGLSLEDVENLSPKK